MFCSSFDGVERVRAGLGVVHVLTPGSQFAKPGVAEAVSEESGSFVARLDYSFFGRAESGGEAGACALEDRSRFGLGWGEGSSDQVDDPGQYEPWSDAGATVPPQRSLGGA